MTELSYVAVPLVLCALLFIILPLLSRRNDQHEVTQDNAQARKKANISAFKERMSELDAECALGEYDEGEVQRLKTDLQRRLLEDVGDLNKRATSNKVPLIVIIALLAFLPIASWLLYDKIGAADDLAVQQTYRALQQANSQAEATEIMTTLIGQLEARLDNGSRNPHYLMLLGRSQMQLQNFPAAADAFQRLMVQTGEDPMVMGSYTQALYLAGNRQLTAQVKRLAKRTLELQPFNSTVLGLMGMASYEDNDFAGAVDYWQRLLRVLEPGSDNARMIEQGIDQAKLRLAESGATSEQQGNQQQAVNAAAVMVDVSLADGMNAAAGDSVFIFARALNGPRMPLAVARLQVADLPAQVRLDDSMAMAPNLTLSSFDEVEVVARISKRGIANPGPGDLEGRSKPIQVKQQAASVAVSIANILP